MDTETVSIEDITITASPSTQADTKTLEEIGYLDTAHAAHLESFKQDVKHRAEYAPKIFWLVVSWIVGIFALLVLQGFHVRNFSLPIRY